MKVSNIKFDFINKILSIDSVEFTEFDEVIKFLKELDEQQSAEYPTPEDFYGETVAKMPALVSLEPGDEFEHTCMNQPGKLFSTKTLIAKVVMSEDDKDINVRLLVCCAENEKGNVTISQFKKIMSQYKNSWFNVEGELEEMYSEDKLLLLSIYDFVKKI